MSASDIWLTTLLLTIGAILTRATFWLIGHRVTIPRRVNDALCYAPACALAAIIVPDLLIHHDEINVSLSNPQLVGGVVAAAFFLYQRSMFVTILLGMTVYSLVRIVS